MVSRSKHSHRLQSMKPKGKITSFAINVLIICPSINIFKRGHWFRFHSLRKCWRLQALPLETTNLKKAFFIFPSLMDITHQILYAKFFMLLHLWKFQTFWLLIWIYSDIPSYRFLMQMCLRKKNLREGCKKERGPFSRLLLLRPWWPLPKPAPPNIFTMFYNFVLQLFWHNIHFVAFYALLCGAKINPKILSVEQKLTNIMSDLVRT